MNVLMIWYLDPWFLICCREDCPRIMYLDRKIDKLCLIPWPVICFRRNCTRIVSNQCLHISSFYYPAKNSSWTTLLEPQFLDFFWEKCVLSALVVVCCKLELHLPATILCVDSQLLSLSMRDSILGKTQWKMCRHIRPVDSWNKREGLISLNIIFYPRTDWPEIFRLDDELKCKFQSWQSVKTCRILGTKCSDHFGPPHFVSKRQDRRVWYCNVCVRVPWARARAKDGWFDLDMCVCGPPRFERNANRECLISGRMCVHFW